MIRDLDIREKEDIENDEGSIQKFATGDFGEIYFSTVRPGITKGWHLHEEQTSTLSCVSGRVRLVLHDMREDSPTEGETQELVLGDGERKTVTIPPGVAYAWKNLSPDDSIIANLASHEHGTTPSRKLALDEVPYEW